MHKCATLLTLEFFAESRNILVAAIGLPVVKLTFKMIKLHISGKKSGRKVEHRYIDKDH